LAFGKIDSRLEGPRAMRKQNLKKKRHAAPKAVLQLPDLDQAKSAVLNSRCKQRIRNAVNDPIGIQPKRRLDSDR